MPPHWWLLDDSQPRLHYIIREARAGAARSVAGGGNHCFYVGDLGSAAEKMRINSSGNVLVGSSTNPSSSNVKQLLYTGSDTYLQIASGSTGGGLIGQTGVNMLFYTYTGAVGSEAYSERMRIDSSGNLLVGGTSVISGATFYSASGNGTCSSRCTTTTSGHYYSFGHDGNDNFRVLNAASTGVYLTYGGTSWTALSDETTKTDLLPIENAINKVSTLRAVTGRYKTDNKEKSRSFLIAQDVQKVLPEAVNETFDGKLGLQYTDLIPLLVASIKELNAKVDAQALEIQVLKGN